MYAGCVLCDVNDWVDKGDDISLQTYNVMNTKNDYAPGGRGTSKFWSIGTMSFAVGSTNLISRAPSHIIEDDISSLM